MKINGAVRAGCALIAFATFARLPLGYSADYGGQKWPPLQQKGVKVFSPPEDQVAPTNGVACFIVDAEADDTKNQKSLAYQWLKGEQWLTNDSRILGATNATLIISNVQVSDVGFYSCLVAKVDQKGNKGPAVRVRSGEEGSPGARLFVFRGTNTTYSGPYQAGKGTRTCIGDYVGKVIFKMQGSTSTWFSRPTGTTSVTATDLPGVALYGAKIQIIESYSQMSTCGVSIATFSPTKAPPTYKYQFTTYVTSGTPPDIINLDIQWNP